MINRWSVAAVFLGFCSTLTGCGGSKAENSSPIGGAVKTPAPMTTGSNTFTISLGGGSSGIATITKLTSGTRGKTATYAATWNGADMIIYDYPGRNARLSFLMYASKWNTINANFPNLGIDSLGNTTATDPETTSNVTRPPGSGVTQKLITSFGGGAMTISP